MSIKIIPLYLSRNFPSLDVVFFGCARVSSDMDGIRRGYAGVIGKYKNFKCYSIKRWNFSVVLQEKDAFREILKKVQLGKRIRFAERFDMLKLEESGGEPLFTIAYDAMADGWECVHSEQVSDTFEFYADIIRKGKIYGTRFWIEYEEALKDLSNIMKVRNNAFRSGNVVKALMLEDRLRDNQRILLENVGRE